MVTAHQSVERALRLLSSFDDAHGELSVSELARAAGIHKSTASRLAAVLERRGYLRRQQDGYRPGTELIRLGAVALGSFDLRDAMRPAMERLSRLTGETVNLAVPDGGEVLNIAEIPSVYILSSSSSWTGRRTAPHAAANGKILLAHGALEMPERLDTYTRRTLTSRRRLLAELAEVRHRGYATARSELEEGLVAVAAPVLDGSGRCVAALSVSGPEFRLSPTAVDRIGRLCASP